MEYGCFVPGCTNVYHLNRYPKSPSYYTYHRLPEDRKLLDQLLALLDLPETTETDSESVMCSAHFHPIIEHIHLVRSLLEEMIQEKPSVMAVSSAPRCAASVAGCCMNLYSGVALFKFPEAGRSFDLWRMVAGSPPLQDCLYLCARHFKRNSFVDLNMEELIEGSIPVYPTRPLHPVHMNYRPLKKPFLRPDPTSGSNVVDPYQDNNFATAKPKYDIKKKWRCAAVGCDVSSESHPDMRKINMPPYNDRLSLWREIVGDTPSTKYNNSLCTRHFGINQFYDGETRKNFVKMTNPVYPTGQLNLNTMDYCPPELDITVAMETDGDENLVVVTIEDDGQSETEIIEDVTDVSPADVGTIARCSSVGCPVASKTHPNVKIFNFPYKTPKRINSWLRIAGETCIQPLRLCARHFDIYKRELIPKYPFWDLDPETQTYKPIFNPANPKCCVPRCNQQDEEDISYHRFPLDKEAFKIWVQRIGWKQLELYDKGDVFRGFRICSQHFSRRWFMTNENGERVLRPGAIPTLFQPSDNIEESNEEDYEVAVINSSNLTEGSSMNTEVHERNLSPVNPKKRGSSLQITHYSELKKPKVIRQSKDSESTSTPQDPSGCPTSSNDPEISFWIASPSKSCATNGEEMPDMEEILDSASKEEAVSLSSLDNSGDSSGHIGILVVTDDTEGFSIQKPIELFYPDVENVDSDVDRRDSPHDTQEGQDSSNIEESETDLLWTEPSTPKQRTSTRDGDLIDSASRLCNFSPGKIDKLRSLTGKDKNALNELKELLVEHLTHVITITGVDFLKKCFEHVVNGTSKKPKRISEKHESSEEERKFAVSLQSLSGKGYNTFSQVANLPPPSAVREWATNDVGYPGFNKHAFAQLSNKLKELRRSVFFVSLCVAEVAIDKHIDWNGSDLFGYVDLGCGRISDDFILEASSVLLFHVNGVTHDFTLPLGYRLIRDLSPKIRANLINQYILQLHSIGIKCIALVCDGSAMTYRTYTELGVFTDDISSQCGYFKHPANKIDNIYCFIDIDDTMMVTKNFLAENEFFLNKYKNKIRWSDVEQLQDFLQWDLNSKVASSPDVEEPGSAIGELRKLQVQLKNDSRPFKKNGALALKHLYQRYCRSVAKAEGTIEFLTRMESISDLFSRRNMFSRELPAIRRDNTTLTLGSIKSHLVYLNSLTDMDDVELVSGTRRIPILYLLLNLVSLEGFLKKIFIYEKKKRPKIVCTQSFTLRNTRETIKQLVSVAGGTLTTASQFRDAFVYLFCGNYALERLPKYLCTDETLFGKKEKLPTMSHPQIGLVTSKSYKYKRLSRAYERFDDFLTETVLRTWLESSGCPDCRCLIVNVINHYEEGKCSLISDVNNMLKIAEKHLLCLCDEIPLNAVEDRFYLFANSVLNEMVYFDGFKSHEHLFDSVEFGRICHFTIMVKEFLRIFLTYRISYMPTQTKVFISPGLRTTFNRRSWT